MSKSGFSLDFKDFDKKFTRIIERAIPEAAADGLRQAGQEWKLDADNVEPRTPHKEGFLRGSGEVSKAKITARSIDVEVTYDEPYAKRWHEAEPGTVKWSELGVGPKYLESKAVRFMKKYM
ncbi:unnamed protein product, partial [marine sediment metagenome]